MNEIVSSKLKELQSSRSLQYKMKKCSVTTQFVPLSANFKQDIIQGRGEINMEPAFQEFTVK